MYVCDHCHEAYSSTVESSWEENAKGETVLVCEYCYDDFCTSLFSVLDSEGALKKEG